MGVLVMDCPHEGCSATHATFSVESVYVYQKRGDFVRHWVTLACPVCAQAVLTEMAAPSALNLKQYSGTLEAITELQIYETVPSPRSKAAPDFVDPHVARTFERANGAIKRGEAETAGMLLRKMLDTVLTNKFPHTGNGMLGQKMAKLVANTDLPGSMVDWAKEIKDFGNESAHEAPEPDMQQMMELRDFAELLLTYVYTLPHRLEQMRGHG